MAPGSATNQQGVFIENGSGGYLGDLTFNGGRYGLQVGNQQFTMRNLVFNNVQTAIRQIWSWGWTYQGISINNCEVGFDFTSIGNDPNTPATLGLYQVGSITILDSSISNTPIGILIGNADAVADPRSVNNFIFENIALNNVSVAIRDNNDPGSDALVGTPTNTVISAWGKGNQYNAATAQSNTPSTPIPGTFQPFTRPPSLLGPNGRYYTRSKPLYTDLPASSFLSARSFGAVGNGQGDDAEALNELFAAAAEQGKVAFIDHGQYVVRSTVFIPPGARIVGESYPQIVSAGPFFNSIVNPRPVVQIGNPGQAGSVEWSDTIVSTRGQQVGAIAIQYNLASAASTPSGMWDVHVRIGGFAGSNLQLADCPKTPAVNANNQANINQNCIAAFMSMHITAPSSGLYMENCWFWVADHDIEDEANNSQITVYAGRGMLVESLTGPVWLVGTGVEHHQMYEYQLYNTNNIQMGQIQTETAYYQPNPDARFPFPPDARFHDPLFLAPGEDGWGLRVVSSKGVRVYGAGLYSFFNNYEQEQCIANRNCQRNIFSLEGAGNDVSVYNLNTVGTTYMATRDGVDIIPSGQNVGMFVASVAWVHT